MDPKENSGRLLEEDLARLYGMELDEDRKEEDAEEGNTDECSGSDSQ